ncbi:Gp49 family protein [Shewanella sp. Koi 1]
MIKTVTSAMIEALLATVECKTHIVEGTTTTVAVALLPIGETKFSLATAISACADPRKFDAALGAKYAIEQVMAKANEKLWELEGYCLSKEINGVAPVTDHIDRMIIEHNELMAKLVKLNQFVEGDKFKSLDSRDRLMLSCQAAAMEDYAECLHDRLKDFGCILFTGSNWPELVEKFGGGEVVGGQFVTPAGDSFTDGMWVK